MDEALELQALVCCVTRTEAGSESRLGTDTRSLSEIPARERSTSQRVTVQKTTVERREKANSKSKMV